MGDGLPWPKALVAVVAVRRHLSHWLKTRAGTTYSLLRAPPGFAVGQACRSSRRRPPVRKGISQPPDPCHVAEVKSLGPRTGFLHSLSKRIQSPCCCTGLFSPGNNQDGGNIFNRATLRSLSPQSLGSRLQVPTPSQNSTVHNPPPRTTTRRRRSITLLSPRPRLTNRPPDAPLCCMAAV